MIVERYSPSPFKKYFTNNRIRILINTVVLSSLFYIVNNNGHTFDDLYDDILRSIILWSVITRLSCLGQKQILDKETLNLIHKDTKELVHKKWRVQLYVTLAVIATLLCLKFNTSYPFFLSLLFVLRAFSFLTDTSLSMGINISWISNKKTDDDDFGGIMSEEERYAKGIMSIYDTDR